MQFVTTSELRRPEAWHMVQAGRSIVTSHGKPIALMLPVTSEDYEETLEMISQLEATRALARMQAEARRTGLDRLTVEEIDAEITATRLARRARGAERADRP